MKKLFASLSAAALLFGLAGTSLAQSTPHSKAPIQIAQGAKMGKMDKKGGAKKGGAKKGGAKKGGVKKGSAKKGGAKKGGMKKMDKKGGKM